MVWTPSQCEEVPSGPPHPMSGTQRRPRFRGIRAPASRFCRGSRAWADSHELVVAHLILYLATARAQPTLLPQRRQTRLSVGKQLAQLVRVAHVLVLSEFCASRAHVSGAGHPPHQGSAAIMHAPVRMSSMTAARLREGHRCAVRRILRYSCSVLLLIPRTPHALTALRCQAVGRARSAVPGKDPGSEIPGFLSQMHPAPSNDCVSAVTLSL